MLKHCDCMPEELDPLSDVLSHELDGERERRKAEDWANTAKSWAIGEGMGKKRPDEATDNAKYYARQAKGSETAAAGAFAQAVESAAAAKASEKAAAGSRDAAAKSAAAAKTSENATAAGKQAVDELATRAEAAATLAESWAQGGTKTRAGEDTDNAKYYARQAKGSETAAAGSAAAAEASKTAAAKSAEDAAGSAKAAGTSAADAAASKTAAATSATNAKNAETAAKTSQTAADTSAKNAASSAAAASTSASDAKTSADAAKASQTAAKASADAAAADSKVIKDNLTDIQEVADNIEAVKSASDNATRAEAAAESAETDAAKAEAAADRATSIAQGQLGYFETEAALKAAHATGQNGEWAIVGETDTIWVWDQDTKSWSNSGNKTDLSKYYTKEQTDAEIDEVQKALGAAKQDKLTGTSGQVVGFDSSRNATAVDVGGRNFARNTSADWSEWIVPTPDTDNRGHHATNAYLPTGKKAGDKYTYSIEIEFSGVKASTSGSFFFQLQGAVDGVFTHRNIWGFRPQLTLPPADGIYKYSYTNNLDETSVNSSVFECGFRCNYWGAGKYRYRCIKVERGSVATDWSPAPEDLQSKLNGTAGQIVGFDESGVASSVDIGGRNYIINSTKEVSLTGTTTTQATNIDIYTASQEVSESLFDRVVTVSADYDCNITSGECGFAMQGTFKRFFYFSNSTNGTGHLQKVVENPVLTDTQIRYLVNGQILFLQGFFTGTVKVWNIKLEAGSVATDWTPAPEDKLDVDATAAAANKLATARNLKVNLASTGTATFDGSANQENIPVTGILPPSQGGTGVNNSDDSQFGFSIYKTYDATPFLRWQGPDKDQTPQSVYISLRDNGTLYLSTSIPDYIKNFYFYTTAHKPTPADIGAQPALTFPLSPSQGGTGSVMNNNSRIRFYETIEKDRKYVGLDVMGSKYYNYVLLQMIDSGNHNPVFTAYSNFVDGTPQHSQRFYSTTNKPTPADIGLALPLSPSLGGTGSSSSVCKIFTKYNLDANTYIEINPLDENANTYQVFRLMASGKTGEGMQLADYPNLLFETQAKGGTQHSQGIYTTAHKPTASDIAFSDGKTFQQKLDAGELRGPQGPAGTTPTIEVAAGSDIGSAGTPSVTKSTSGTTTTLTFHQLKGAKGDKGDKGDAGTAGPTGPQGPAGPNTVSTTTATDIAGLLKGVSGKVAKAVAGTDYVAPDGSISGNAGTATRLATARSLKTNLASTATATFDGSAAQESIPVTGILGTANGGTGQSNSARINSTCNDSSITFGSVVPDPPTAFPVDSVFLQVTKAGYTANNTYPAVQLMTRNTGDSSYHSQQIYTSQNPPPGMGAKRLYYNAAGLNSGTVTLSEKPATGSLLVFLTSRGSGLEAVDSSICMAGCTSFTLMCHGESSSGANVCRRCTTTDGGKTWTLGAQYFEYNVPGSPNGNLCSLIAVYSIPML